MKIQDAIKPYNGRGCIVEWLDKLEAAAEMTGEKDLLKVLSLLLEGPAYSVYSQLAEKDKKDVGKIKAALISSFGLDPFEAFSRFCQMRYDGEGIDVYAANLRNLAKQAEIESDEVIRKKLATSLPDGVSRQLRALISSTDADLPGTIKLARTLMAQLAEKEVVAVVKETKMADARNNRRQIECWSCGRKGHITRWCPNRRQGNGQRELYAPAVSQEM